MSVEFKVLGLQDVLLIKPQKHIDERGIYMEIFKNAEYLDLGLPVNFVQDNLVYSKKNVLRGLHYQNEPTSQGKLITPIKGQIFDVAVDVRPKSDTYGQYVSIILSEEKSELLYIPSGFAHGFLTLTDYSIITYKTTKTYSSKDEGGIIWNDSSLGINWPTKNPILSEKDKHWPFFQ